MPEVSAPERFTSEATLALSDIVERLREVEPGRRVEICADELLIDTSIELDLRDVLLHARVVSCPAAACVSFVGDGDAGCWQILFGQLQGDAAAALELRCMGLRLPSDPSPDSTMPPRQGFRATWSMGEHGGELRIDEIDALAGDPLVLTDILLKARRLKQVDPAAAIDRVRWVVAASAAATRQGSGGQERLYAESLQMLSHLTSPQRAFRLVPYLERGIYVKQAGELLAALEAVDADLRVVDDREHDIAGRRMTAEGLLQRIDNTAELTQKLLDQSSRNLADAQAELQRATEKLDAQSSATDKTRKAFDAALDDWQRKQTILAVFSAILGIGLAIAAICTANPAGAAAGISGAAKAAKEAGDAAEKIRKIVELLKKIKEAVETTLKLKQLIEGINQVRAAIAAGQKAAELTQRLDESRKLLPAAGDSMRPEDWDELRIDMAPLLAPAIEAGIPKAREYLQQIEKLVVRGKANHFATAQVVENAQRYDAMLWTLARDEADRDAIHGEIAAIAAGRPLQHGLRLRFEHARDDIRARVVLAIEHVADAHYYFALAEGAATADASMSTAELRGALGRAADDLVQAYERFDPRPQRWRQTLPIEFTDERRAALRAHGAVTVSVPLVDENFRNYMRIRVAQAKAFFIGAGAPSGAEVQLQISTGSHYRDRYGKARPQPFDFAGRPLRLGFAYVHRNGVTTLPAEGDPEDSVDIRFGGERMDEWNVFFEPTPFTEWQIRLAPETLAHLDLASCQRIDLHLDGSAVLAGFMSPMRGAAPAARDDAAPLITAIEVDTDVGLAAQGEGSDG